jgi:putative flippase GtrA
VTDPTRLRDQPALTQSSGLIWLVVGGIFTAIALGVLIALVQLPPPGVALVAAIVVAALYIGMLVARFAVAPGRRRLGLLAGGMLAIAAVALAATLIVATGASAG